MAAINIFCIFNRNGLEMNPAFWILALTAISAIYITIIPETQTGKKLREKTGFSRIWWVPLLALGVGLFSGLIYQKSIEMAFQQRLHVIIFIFALSILARGLGESGFFSLISYKVARASKGNSFRLLLYMFISTSIITYFTTNDVVVLTITPLIITICMQIRIKNTKLLLLVQFVAANTFSMGMIFGSPKNLIFAEEMSVNFFEYFLIMFVSTAVSLAVTLFIIYIFYKSVIYFEGSFLDKYSMRETYSMPDEIPHDKFTGHMMWWLTIYIISIGAMAISTTYQINLNWVSLPAIFAALFYWSISDKHVEPAHTALKDLPYGIFFFGMTFFIFAQEFSQTSYFQNNLIPFYTNFFDGSPIKTVFWGIFGSGLSVNIFNDLPASALISHLTNSMEVSGVFNRVIMIQSVLVGLNIGAYLSPIGALAGIIWFNEIRAKRNQLAKSSEFVQSMIFPDKFDMIKFGIVLFTMTGLITGISILATGMLMNLFVTLV